MPPETQHNEEPINWAESLVQPEPTKEEIDALLEEKVKVIDLLESQWD